MNPEDKIKELINKSDAKTVPGVDDRILGDASKHLEKLKQQRSAPSRPNFWRTIMKSPKTKLAAAAVVLITALLSILYFYPVSTVYALSDATKLMSQARTLHISMKYFLNKDEMRSEYWYDLENGRKYSYWEGITSEPNPEAGNPIKYVPVKYVLETVYDSQYIMKVNHKNKTVDYGKLLASQKQPNKQMIANRTLTAAVQDMRYLNQYHKTGTGQLEGQAYDIWQREFKHTDSGYSFRFEIWVSPSTGSIVKIRRFVNYNKSRREWELQTETYKIEKNVELPANIFATDPPKGYIIKNSKANAPLTGIGFEAFEHKAGHELRVLISFTLEDGSVLSCWNATHPSSKSVSDDYLEQLAFGGDLPEMPIALYGLMSNPDKDNPQPTTYYLGRHLIHTYKKGEFYEWALYVPQHQVINPDETKFTLAVMKLSAQDPNLPEHMPVRGLISPTITQEDFEQYVRDAMLELSDYEIVDENLTYNNLIKLAIQTRNLKHLYANFSSEVKEAKERIMELKSVKIITPEQARQQVKQVVESFYTAIREGRDNDAIRLLKYEEPRASRAINTMRRLLEITPIHIDSIYVDETTALVITTELGLFEGQKARFVISLLKGNGTWLIEKFKSITTDGMQEVIDDYLKSVPNAKHFSEN